jgi:sulfoxide reductase heme-binding subunit YedZ
MRNRARPALIAAGSVALTLLITVVEPRQTRVEELSLATAYVAIVLLAVSLSLGPLNLLRRKHNPVHNAVRRDFGIAAGIGALIHTALGLQVHMGGRLTRYFAVPEDLSSGSIAFVAANYLGLLSALIFLGLVAISNNYAIRRMGLPPWKRAQRLAYVAALAAAVHGFLYQFIERRGLAGIVVAVSIFIFVWLLQLRGRGHRTSSTTQ